MKNKDLKRSAFVESLLEMEKKDLPLMADLPDIEPWKIQGSPSWLKFRQGKIGCSDVPIIMGENPYKTPYKLWREKTGRDRIFVNDAMRHGTATEPLAREWYENKTGNPMFPDVLVHPNFPWFIASLDGLSPDGLVLEIKSPKSKAIHLLAKNGMVPSHNYGQVQGHLEVAGVDEADFVSYQDGDGIIVRQKRDQEYIDRMIPKLKEFHTWVMHDTFPGAPDEEVSEVSYNKIIELKEAKEQADYWKAQYELKKDELIISNNNHPFSAHGVTLIKTMPKGRINYSKIPELKDVDLDAYRSESKEQWTLRIDLSL